MRTIMRILAVSAVFLISAASALFAAEHERSSFEGMAIYLGLNPVQIASINQEVENFVRAQQPAVAKRGQCEAQMERAIDAQDAAVVGRLTLERIALNRQFNEERKALQNRIRSILTPQQAEKLDRAIEVLHFVGISASVLEPLNLGAEEHEVPIRILEGRMKVPGGGGSELSHAKEIRP